MKTLVLLHGHGMDDTLWDEIVPLLDGDFTIVRPNVSLLTGCRTMEAYADELHRLLTASQIDKFTLIGHSMGGYISLAFAEKYPGMLEGFGLFHSSALADDDTKKEQRNQMAELLRTHGTDAFLQKTASNLFGQHYKDTHPEKVQKYTERYGKLPAEALAVGMEAMRDRPDRTHVLAELPFSMIFIVGMDDQVVPFEKVMEQARFPKMIYPFVLADAGHLGMIERPEASARILRWYVGQEV
ncbi:alpha/beta fold hydrolase [Persicitalea sp.]|uniref:alpha/beta fold hydrolase n=1 Tax=Persicitalea sp. TaxID=3100273 RepID=UPI0035942072